MSNVLGIETSCDETSVAIVDSEKNVRINLVSSQILRHKPYGGVVPEIASRAHLEMISPLVAKAFKETQMEPGQIDLVAATRGPGLASSLLIGLSFAKGLSLSLGKPFIGINHLHGHLLSPLLSGQIPAGALFPNISLIVSGGHTLLLHTRSSDDYTKIGSTLDDAAGEAFDKVAKLIGLEYPGGPMVDTIGASGNPHAFEFPRGLSKHQNYHFSFSGLKTAIRYFLEKQPADFIQKNLADICASAQEAICEVLVSKTIRAAMDHGVKVITVSGGVSCNTRLRHLFEANCARENIRLFLCPPLFSTDNAAMIALVASYLSDKGIKPGLDEDIAPNLGF